MSRFSVYYLLPPISHLHALVPLESGRRAGIRWLLAHLKNGRHLFQVRKNSIFTPFSHSFHLINTFHLANNTLSCIPCSFLNSCANPVALYCVSGVFRQHFHRYLCCKPMVSPNRLLGHSTATNVCDTSFSSTMRRNTIKSHGGGGGGVVVTDGHHTNGHSVITNGNGNAKLNGSDSNNNNGYWHQNSGRVDSGVDRKNSQNIISMEKRWNLAPAEKAFLWGGRYI